MAKILGFSGTAIKSGTIEKAMEHVLRSSEAEYEMIRLSELDIKPCMGCLECAKDNRCIQKDDMNQLLDKILEAEALVFSGFPTFGTLNALTKTFLERLYPVRHKVMLTKGKIGAAIAGGIINNDAIEKDLCGYFGWLEMECAGSIKIDGNVPCLSCGYGETCDQSVAAMMYGKGTKITPELFYRFENDEETKEKATELGRKLGDAIRNK
ncbi:flavodoxin family protein [Wukongibacter baidiensis]|uniref:flavodoxin family protein n=1 Tax=Wukongibacter baidiensis TaxID=1723361 RepID=UPI003D7F63B9